MDMSRNLLSNNDPNLYGNDDAFDAYIDMDFLRNDAMEEDVDLRSMSNSDLFHYYLEEELIKDPELLEQTPTTYSTPTQSANEFSLVTDSVPVNEDLKLTPMSIIEGTNEVSQQLVPSTAVAPSLAMLNAQLAELLAKLPTIKQETTTNKSALSTGSNSPKSNETQTVNSSTNSVNNAQKSDDNNPVDLKKLSSKERRQIRNKISARNFRVRRKETTKEQQQEEINILKQALVHLQEENKKLQQEVDKLRKQQDTKSIVTSPPSPPHIPSPSSASKDNNNINLSLSKITSNNGKISRSIVNQNKGTMPSMPQPSSPTSRYLVIPNVNKDASPSSSSANKKTWQDSRVRVQTTFIPEFSLDKHLFEEKSVSSYLDFRNTYPYRYPSMINLIEFSQSKDGQRFWLAHMLISTAMQQMTKLFIEAVCATPINQMISALFPNSNTPALEPVNEVDLQSFEPATITPQPSLKDEQLSDDVTEVQQQSLLDSNTMVESVKEASVLDWLYDAMVSHVIEQSQREVKMMELSDWVGEEWDDNVLPFLF
ncbi:14393_t:CDS:2 [Funneliformis geosporum]|uniref:7670_t:CDS:1 n=1 Tax=Funneliformis geosporum TaxID=1117311 RepID=A0A9W4WVN9_9GLOM|nr:7670_t:CDS:2 [Funneliformis geosporum]CAI2180605.1 14393_t:CDS:2 [Funneliformis geosporum]